MAGSASQFSRPLGMGGYWSYTGWQIFEMAIILKEWKYSEGVTKIRREWQYLNGMTKIWKEWQKSGNANSPKGMTIMWICGRNDIKYFFEKKLIFLLECFSN